DDTPGADQLIRRVASALRETFAYECVGVALVGGESLVYHFSGSAGANTFAPPIRPPLTDVSMVGRVVLTGGPLRVDDLRADPSLSLAPGLPSARAELATPVISGGPLLAVVGPPGHPPQPLWF